MRRALVIFTASFALLTADAAGSEEVPAACHHPCALLREFPFAYLQHNFCALCGGGNPESDACTLDWPSSDVPSCESWDYMRNCIYATYGYPFKQKRWQEVFGQEPWYRPDPKFTPARLSPAALRNVKLLKRKKERKEDCEDVPAG